MTTTIFDLKEKNFSIIGVNSKSEGKIFYNGHVRFYAEHQGELKMAANSKLIIERYGLISGKLYCHELGIYGQFDGHCHSSAWVIIYPGAKVSGVIHAESLIIYPGAQVNIEGHTAQTIN